MIDTTLDHQVLTALEANAHLRGRQLRFETEKGRVTLQGSVRSFFQKQMAQEAIRHLDGVQEIANELEVSI
ncbi:MAG: BON domain-containing protein [Pirellulales bacterium]|nr:BON domain-containing protein [Pirellulales bacterium]